MTLLILGLALWIGAHLFKRAAPGPRAALDGAGKGGAGKGGAGKGGAGKGLVAVAVLAGLVAMVLGYRGAAFVPLYTPPPGMGHLNNLLMLIALTVFGAGAVCGVIRTHIRHPQLTGVMIWAAGHLLVNGDLASVVLFGGLLGWAVAEVVALGRAEGAWARPAAGPWQNDLKAVAVAVVLYALAAGIHIWTGHNPFLGTYP